jgi:hypothetical protein
MKGNGSLHPLVLCSFYKKRVSIMLQHVYVISILKHVVAIGEGLSKLNMIFSKGPFISLFDMLLATGGGSRT